MKFYCYLDKNTTVNDYQNIFDKDIALPKYKKENLIMKPILEGTNDIEGLSKCHLFLLSREMLCRKEEIPQYQRFFEEKEIQLHEIYSKDFIPINEIKRRNAISFYRQGKCVRPPYGYDLINNELIPNEAEQEIIKIILEIWEQKHSISKVCKYLQEKNINLRDSTKIHYNSVKRIISKHAS